MNNQKIENYQKTNEKKEEKNGKWKTRNTIKSYSFKKCIL